MYSKIVLSGILMPVMGLEDLPAYLFFIPINSSYRPVNNCRLAGYRVN
jgi:hypothetical protein